METLDHTYQQNTTFDSNKRGALRLMLYIAMASITMFFAVTTSAVIVKKADVMNWAQFPLPSIFAVSTVLAIASSLFFYLTYNMYKKQNYALYKVMLVLAILVSAAFLVSQYLGFVSLKEMDFPLAGNVSGSFVYFLAIAHGLHIIGGIVISTIVFIKSHFSSKKLAYEGGNKPFPNRLFSLELLTSYWHFVNVLWVYLYLFFYFNYQ